MKVIILNGSGGVGKDTFANYIKEYVLLRGHEEDCIHTSIIKPVKDIAHKVCWGGGKEEKDRKFLSDLKDILDRYCDLPFLNLCDTLENYWTRRPYGLLIVDIREPRDIRRFCNELINTYNMSKRDIRTVLINNPNVEPITSNIADASIDGYDYDYVIDNAGTKEELRSKAHRFIIDFMY